MINSFELHKQIYALHNGIAEDLKAIQFYKSLIGITNSDDIKTIKSYNASIDFHIQKAKEKEAEIKEIQKTLDEDLEQKYKRR